MGKNEVVPPCLDDDKIDDSLNFRELSPSDAEHLKHCSGCYLARAVAWDSSTETAGTQLPPVKVKRSET